MEAFTLAEFFSLQDFGVKVGVFLLLLDFFPASFALLGCSKADLPR